MAEEMLAKIKEDTRQERDEFKNQWNDLGKKIEEEKTKCELINKKNQKEKSLKPQSETGQSVYHRREAEQRSPTSTRE